MKLISVMIPFDVDSNAFFFSKVRSKRITEAGQTCFFKNPLQQSVAKPLDVKYFIF